MLCDSVNQNCQHHDPRNMSVQEKGEESCVKDNAIADPNKILRKAIVRRHMDKNEGTVARRNDGGLKRSSHVRLSNLVTEASNEGYRR